MLPDIAQRTKNGFAEKWTDEAPGGTSLVTPHLSCTERQVGRITSLRVALFDERYGHWQYGKGTDSHRRNAIIGNSQTI